MLPVLLLTLLLPVPGLGQAVQTLRITVTDASGTSTQLANPQIDYTYRRAVGLVTSGRIIEPTGIRVRRGDGALLVAWNKLSAVAFRRGPIPEGSVEGPLLLDITRTNGTKETFEVQRTHEEAELFGETEDGRYSIELRKIRSISVTAR